MAGAVAMVTLRPKLALPCSTWEPSWTMARIALLSSDGLPQVSSLSSRKEQVASMGCYGMSSCGVIVQKSSKSSCRRGSRRCRVEASAKGGPQGLDLDLDLLLLGAGVGKGGQGAKLKNALEKVTMPNLITLLSSC